MGNTLSTSTPTASPSSGVDRLFQTLLGFYGNKFVDLWRDLDIAQVKATWRQELRTMTASEILAGLEGCRARPWPPTLPEFLLLCRPPMNPHIAWIRAQEGCWARDAGHAGFTDERIFEAYRRMAGEVRTGGPLRGALLDQWTATLAIVEQEINLGARFPIPAPRQHLPAPPPATREQAGEWMERLRAQVAARKREAQLAAEAAAAAETNAQQGQEGSDKP